MTITEGKIRDRFTQKLKILFFGQKIQSSIGPQVSVQEFASKVSFS